MLSLVMCAVPPPRKRTTVKKTELKQAITQAKNLCIGYEDTIECRLAWEKVEELSAALADQEADRPRSPLPRTERANREYDL